MVVNACTRVHMRWRRFKRKFSRHTAVVKRFSSLGRAFLGAPRQGQARWLLGVLLALCLAVGGLQVLISYAARDFMTALVNRNTVAFYHNLWRYLGAFVLAVPVAVFYRNTGDRLSLAWRQWMTEHLIQRYFSNRVYYRLRSSELIDNPDQRITEDVKLFTTRRDLIKGLLPREGLAVLWGKWKSIKSFWLLDALMHVALGWDYRGRRVQQGPVIYLVLEAPGGFMTRVVGWLQTFLADHEMPPFGIIACNIDLVRDHVALIDSIRSALGGIAPAVIAIDTVNRSLAGSEGADQDMSAYVAACDAVQKALGGLIVLVHHHGHNDTRMRGFTGLPAAEDVELFSKREGDLHTIEVTQRRDGATGDRVVSRVEEVIVGQDDDGQVITTLVLRSVDDEWEVPLTHEQIFEQAVEAA